MLLAPDVFISYAHLSNKDDNAGQNGWVARFHNDLKAHLDELLGRETRVWRDNKMAFGTDFDKAIGNRLRKHDYVGLRGIVDGHQRAGLKSRG